MSIHDTPRRSASTMVRDPDLLVEASDIAAMGYGHAATIRARIRSGELPAVKVGGRWKVRVGDLPRPAVDTSKAPPVSEDVDTIARALVDALPPLTDSQRTELGRLLGSCAEHISAA